MDDTLLFIPPCCVDKKLPKAVMHAPGRLLTFYTHSDVTMEKFYRAVACLLTDPHIMVLTMPTVNNEVLSFLLQCFERGWVTHLVLTTRDDAQKTVVRYLGDYMRHVLYATGDDVTQRSAHMVLYNRRQALTLTGPMFARHVDSGLSCYTMHFMPRHLSTTTNALEWGNVLRNVCFPDCLRHRQRVWKEKIKLKGGMLDRFVHMEFPPYKEDDE